MKLHEFYAKYADTPLGERFRIITNASNNHITGMALNDIYQELKAIDDKLRDDEIRREQLLRDVDFYHFHINK
jgi:hypothetical protein